MSPILISKIFTNKVSRFRRYAFLGCAMTVTGMFTLGSSSCATSKGFGRDVQKVGDKIEDAADRTGGAR